MKTLHRNKRTIYVCELSPEDNIKKYKEPRKLKENWQVSSTDTDLLSMGIESYSYIRIKTDISHYKYYHIGDRVYVATTPPEQHDVYCETADYEVSEVPLPTLNECEIMLKKLSGKYGSRN